MQHIKCILFYASYSLQFSVFILFYIYFILSISFFASAFQFILLIICISIYTSQCLHLILHISFYRQLIYLEKWYLDQTIYHMIIKLSYHIEKEVFKWYITAYDEDIYHCWKHLFKKSYQSTTGITHQEPNRTNFGCPQRVFPASMLFFSSEKVTHKNCDCSVNFTLSTGCSYITSST